MTEEAIWRWQEEMFIYSCYLYDKEDRPILSDEIFDQHCKMLSKRYDKLSEEFKSRVPKEQLDASTALGLTYTDSDIAGANAWYDRVMKK